MHGPAEPAVTLRVLTPQDAAVIAGWASDPQFCREAEWTPGQAAYEYERFQRRLIETPPKDLIRLGVVSEGHLVGYVDLHGADPDRRELGFVIGLRNLWGHGLGLGAAAAGLHHGFVELGLQEIWAEAYEANRRSTRILRRLGLRETGFGDIGEFLGAPTRYVQFAIRADEWRHQGSHSAFHPH
ncbi:GNAT family N-acetyltransferase [Krasilnikovia sp. M28-CT-15]|uniref:GNAT family N-acetyltransferase n=1 Tax=Krasilnikovia sp. M28-CT-15 TaxID=3373540 RepID=UPI0038777865